MMIMMMMMVEMMLLLTLLCQKKTIKSQRKVDASLQGKALPEVSDPFLHSSLWQLFNACSVFANNLV